MSAEVVPEDRAAAMSAAVAALLEVVGVAEGGDSLRAIHALTVRHRALDLALAEAVALARLQGMSWQKIGNALGITKAGAWDRFSGRGSGATSDPALPGERDFRLPDV